MKGYRGSEDQNFPLDRMLQCFTFIQLFGFFFFFPQIKPSSCHLLVETCPPIAGMLGVQAVQSCSSHHVAGDGSWETCNLRDQPGFSRFSSLVTAKPLAQTLDTRTCSEPLAAWLPGVCLGRCPHTRLPALPAASLRAGQQPGRSLSEFSWNQCISTKHFTLIRVF